MICCSEDNTNLKRKLCQLRINWMFFMISGSLYAISYTAISSSFHQFVTNPTPNQLKSNVSSEMIAPGLGQSEVFYSWVITLFNLGAMIGAIGSGLLVKFIPYWYLILTILLLHTFGYVLYAVSYEGWVIMLSKLLSGVYIGGDLTLSLSYFAESSEDYRNTLLELGKKPDDTGTIRRKLFAWHNIGVGVGYILGPGAATVFSQFDIDQFRSIAWFNVAFGVAYTMLLVIMFHGESKCQINSRRKELCFMVNPRHFSINPLEIIIVLFLILCRAVLSFRFGVYETIYNPILSDYFGFDERYASYFFFALVVPMIGGTTLLLVIQQLKFDNRIIAIIGLAMSIISCVLLADWQSIPHDKCTEFSLYHHPNFVTSNTDLSADYPSLHDHPNLTMNNLDDLPVDNLYPEMLQSSIHMEISAKIKLNQNQNMINPSIMDRTLTCNASRNLCKGKLSECYIVNRLSGMVNKCPCDDLISDKKLIHEYICDEMNLSLCIHINETTKKDKHRQVFFDVMAQSFRLVPNDVYNTARRECIEAKFKGRYCHWIPDSIITNQHCSDCQPICRSPLRSLNFIQFCIGAALLMLSIPVAWIPIAAMVSERVSSEMQGILMGVIVALTAISRSISPLWLDAAYEAMMKRTFLAMTIMILTHLPFLIIIIVMYPKLGPLDNKSVPERLLEDFNKDHSSDETSASDD